MKIYNLMSGQNFPGGAYHSDWIMAWVALAFLAVLFIVAKKWLGEEEVTGYAYNWLGSFIGLFTYFFTISLFGNAKIALLAGIIGLLGGGFGVGRWIGGNE